MDENTHGDDALGRWSNEGGAMGSGTRKGASGQCDTPAPVADGAGDCTSDRGEGGLPPEIVQGFTRPFMRFVRIEAAAAVMLLLAAAAAMILSNSAWSSSFAAFWMTPLGVRAGSFEFTRSAHHWINDGLLTLFFFVIALELKREVVLGELRCMRTAALSIAGALGGMIGPACVYLVIMNGQPGTAGWGTVTATSTAFVIGSLALLGSRVPPSLRLFLLSLAVFDDVGAVVVGAVTYGRVESWTALAIATLGLAAIAGMARLGIRSILVYFVLGGAIWLCVDASGIHPTVTGVALGLMTPARGWVTDRRLRVILDRVLSYPKGEHWSGDTLERRDLQRAGTAATETLSPLERLEMRLLPWVGFAILPVFALANAGVVLSGADLGQPVFVAIVLALVLGKPIGVITASWIAVRLGLATRPFDLGWPLLAGGALLTGIGFTMSLFIAGLAYSPAMLDTARMAIVCASAVSAIAGLSVLLWLTSKERTVRATRAG